jgi:hypothetical protein
MTSWVRIKPAKKDLKTTPQNNTSKQHFVEQVLEKLLTPLVVSFWYVVEMKGKAS